MHTTQATLFPSSSSIIAVVLDDLDLVDLVAFVALAVAVFVVTLEVAVAVAEATVAAAVAVNGTDIVGAVVIFDADGDVAMVIGIDAGVEGVDVVGGVDSNGGLVGFDNSTPTVNCCCVCALFESVNPKRTGKITDEHEKEMGTEDRKWKKNSGANQMKIGFEHLV